MVTLKKLQYKGGTNLQEKRIDWNNKKAVLEEVKKNRYSFSFASKDLQNDREIVLEAVKNLGFNLSFISKDLQNDREIVLTAVKQNGNALRYASIGLKNDREIVLEAVKQNGSSLVYASENLSRDREIVLEAVKQNGSSFLYVSRELQKDREIILLAYSKMKKFPSDIIEENSFLSDIAYLILKYKHNPNNIIYNEDISNYIINYFHYLEKCILETLGNFGSQIPIELYNEIFNYTHLDFYEDNNGITPIDTKTMKMLRDKYIENNIIKMEPMTNRLTLMDIYS